MSADYVHALDIILNFKWDCQVRKVDCADAFLSGDMTAETYKKVGRYVFRFQTCKLRSEVSR